MSAVLSKLLQWPPPPILMYFVCVHLCVRLLCSRFLPPSLILSSLCVLYCVRNMCNCVWICVCVCVCRSLVYLFSEALLTAAVACG